MVKAIVNPTNAQLEAYKLQRPRFYSLIHDPKVQFRGWLEPRNVEEDDGVTRERWCFITEDGEIHPVSLDDLRRVRVYARNSYMTDGLVIYLFVYSTYGGEKYYYTISREFTDIWLNEERRMSMLNGEHDTRHDIG